MLKAGVGVSADADSYVAGVDACQTALTTLGGTKPKLVIVFASVAFIQADVLRGVRSVAPDALLVGSSSSGEIATMGPMAKHSVVVMAIAGDDLKVASGRGDIKKDGSSAAGSQAAKQVKDVLGDDLRLLIVMSDVLIGNGADTVRGIQKIVGEHLPIVGGASGDDFRFKETFQYLNDEVTSSTVVCLGLGGSFSFGIGVKHGWLPIGIPHRVTKVDGAVVHEIDGKPAIDLYRDYFGDAEVEKLKGETMAPLAVLYPMGMRQKDSDEFLLRAPLSVDEHGSVTCGAEVPPDSEIQLMIGSQDDAIKVAKEAAEHARGDLQGAPPVAILIFNCVARNKLFGDRAGDEIAVIQNTFGPSVPLAGFYTYGEQAPINGEVRDVKRCNAQFHNETVVILALG
ncbi:MAG: FIST signal transduction protein [Minisyncoccota bacterium]